MNVAEFIATAQTACWNRKTTRDQLFAVNDPALWAQRDEILTGLGFEPTAKPAVVPPVSFAAPRQTATKAKKVSTNGRMTLSYAAKDVLTGRELPAGSEALGVPQYGPSRTAQLPPRLGRAVDDFHASATLLTLPSGIS